MTIDALTPLERIALLYVPLAMREVDVSAPPPQAGSEEFDGWSEALIIGLSSHPDYAAARNSFVRSLAWLAMCVPGGVDFGRLHFEG